MLRSLGRCCLERVDLLVAADGAVEVLLVSLSCPLPLLRTRPPSLLVCCFFVFAKLGASSSASRLPDRGGMPVLFRLVSTELLEGDFYTCAQYQAVQHPDCRKEEVCQFLSEKRGGNCNFV